MNDDAWRRCGGWIKTGGIKSSSFSIYEKKSPPNLVDLLHVFLFLFPPFFFQPFVWLRFGGFLFFHNDGSSGVFFSFRPPGNRWKKRNGKTKEKKKVKTFFSFNSKSTKWHGALCDTNSGICLFSSLCPVFVVVSRSVSLWSWSEVDSNARVTPYELVRRSVQDIYLIQSYASSPIYTSYINLKYIHIVTPLVSEEIKIYPSPIQCSDAKTTYLQNSVYHHLAIGQPGV